MEELLSKVKGISQFFYIIAGITLTFLMFLTIADVILRLFRRPIVGTYELVAFSGAVVIGFSMAMTSWAKAHIYVDFFILKFSQKVRNIFHIATRCLGILLFLMIGWNLIKHGWYLYKTGEVSPTIQMPFYPVAYGIGISCFIQCLVLFYDIVKVFGRKNE